MKHNRNLSLLFFAFLFAVLSIAAAVADGSNYLVYVGTQTEGGSKSTGIYAYRYNKATGQITSLGLAAETTNPSWITLHPNGRFLYAVSEVSNYQGPNSGGVIAFSIDRATGKLTFLNEVASRGASPCYLTVDRSGKYLLVANYAGGSIAVFPILADGRLGPSSDLVQHSGHGANAVRQEGPHPHSADLSPDDHFVFVDDLGLDKLFSYGFDANTGKLTGLTTHPAEFEPGAGPRHFILHPSGKFAYVLEEMHSKVVAFATNPQDGSFRQLQSISTVPSDFTAHNDAAELEIHPSGRFLFASNRGQDTIAVFAIDSVKGTLTPLAYTPTGGKTPRTFEVDPAGELLFAANQHSDNIVIFKIDQKTGGLTPTGHVVDIASPVCVKFLSVK